MKIFSCLIPLLFLVITEQECSVKKLAVPGVYRARLEIKGMCMNYTIKVLNGDIDSSLLARDWTDEMTGKKYTNVFALGSICSFPDSIQQGQEFSFRIDTARPEHCAVCMAYYPKPAKRLSIICTDK